MLVFWIIERYGDAAGMLSIMVPVVLIIGWWERRNNAEG